MPTFRLASSANLLRSSCVAFRFASADSLRQPLNIRSIMTGTDQETTLPAQAAAEMSQVPAVKKQCVSPSAPVLQVKKLSDVAKVPTRGSASAAGYDLYSAKECTVPARGKFMVPTDISVAIPQDCYGRVAPRSGLAWKHSIDTGAGVIDSDYRGPLNVILFNFSDEDFKVNPGDRIAQLIIERIMTPEIVEVSELDDTARGSAGFGSTGGFGAAKAQ